MSQWIALVVLGGVLLLVSHWARLRTRTSTDYFLAARHAGAFLTAFGQLANAGLLWALLTVADEAYAAGPAAIWPAAALLLGYVLAWYYLAPGLHALSLQQHSITVGQIFAAHLDRRRYRWVLGSIAVIVLIAILLQTAARWNFASALLAAKFDWPQPAVWITSAACLSIFLMLGGYWAAAVLEALLGLLIVLLLFGFALFALVRAPASASVLAHAGVLQPMPKWFTGHANVVALAFALGIVSAGLADCGQPQALNRFMSARANRFGRSRWLALAILLPLIASTLFLGWWARDALPEGANPDWLVLRLAHLFFPASEAAVCGLIVAYLILGMGSAWLSAASAWVIDLRGRTAASPTSLAAARFAVLLVGVVVMLVHFYWPYAAAPLQNLQLGWQLLGASLGPWLLVRASGKRLRSSATLGALWTGFILTLVFHAMPNAPGDYLERVLPFVAGLGIVLTGGERRGDADRADRSAEERQRVAS